MHDKKENNDIDTSESDDATVSPIDCDDSAINPLDDIEITKLIEKK